MKKLISDFLTDGYCKLKGAISGPELLSAQKVIWANVSERPDQPASWYRDSVLFENGSNPITFKGQTGSVLDELLGSGEWTITKGVGYTQFRFPQRASKPWEDETADWHIDPPFAISTDYKHDLRNREQAVVAHFFWSKTGPGECSILVRPGSHRDAARILSCSPGGTMTNHDLSSAVAAKTFGGEVRELFGEAGDLILVHGLLLHCGGPHLGTWPRVISTAMIELRTPPRFTGRDLTPYERSLCE